MGALLWVLLLQAGNTSVPPVETVTGIVRTTDGSPAAGVRVAAIAVSEDPTAEALFSIAITDEAGRYRLERLPKGQYHIVAGRLDQLTYYPGTMDRSARTVVDLQTVQSSFDFVLADASLAPPAPLSNPMATVAPTDPRVEPFLPIQMTVEGAATEDLSGLRLRLKRVGSNLNMSRQLKNGGIFLPPPQQAEYEVTLEGIPPGYVLKSLTYGPTDLSTATLKITEQDLIRARPVGFVIRELQTGISIVLAAPASQ